MSLELLKPEIEGVEIKVLKTHADDRGFFREIIRETDPFFTTKDKPPFGQWSHSKMAENTIKAWHYHQKQIDWWYVGMGTLRVGLIDNRTSSPSYKKKMDFLIGESLGDQPVHSAVVKIPQGVLHGCRVISPFAHLFYITSETYNTEDEGRIPYNAPEVDFDWGNLEGTIVAENDKKYFNPSSPLSM